MNFQQCKAMLLHNAGRIRQLVQDVSEEQARWRPQPDAWSILEVVNHLYDEERSDFRVRLDIILHRPQEPFPPIDPQGWVQERRYNQRQRASSLQNFLAERRASLVWLDGLGEPDWEATVQAPWGSLSAGDMFAAWVAHDTLHMRQLVELHHDYIVHLTADFDPQYAGEW